MKEKNKNIFYDVKSLERTMDIEKRCNKGYLQNENLPLPKLYINTSGKLSTPKGLVGSLCP